MKLQALISDMLVARNNEVLSAVSYGIVGKLHSKSHAILGCNCDICQRRKSIRALKIDIQRRGKVLERYDSLYSGPAYKGLCKELRALEEQLNVEQYELAQIIKVTLDH